MNIAHLLLQSARRLPDQPAIALGGKVLSSYQDFSRRVSRLASGITAKFNLKPGDRVALAMKNCPEYWELMFACWHAGLAAVPMNAKLHCKACGTEMEGKPKFCKECGAKIEYR